MTIYRVTWTATTVEEFSVELSAEELQSLATPGEDGQRPDVDAIVASPERYDFANNLAHLDDADLVTEQFGRTDIHVTPVPQADIFALADIVATAERVLGVPMNVGFAGGGLVEVWTETHEGYVVFIGEEFGPLAPNRENHVIIGGFLVGAMAGSAETYRNGADGDIAHVFKPTLDALAEGIAMVQEQMKGITQA